MVPSLPQKIVAGTEILYRRMLRTVTSSRPAALTQSSTAPLAPGSIDTDDTIPPVGKKHLRKPVIKFARYAAVHVTSLLGESGYVLSYSRGGGRTGYRARRTGPRRGRPGGCGSAGQRSRPARQDGSCTALGQRLAVGVQGRVGVGRSYRGRASIGITGAASRWRGDASRSRSPAGPQCRIVSAYLPAPRWTGRHPRPVQHLDGPCRQTHRQPSAA
jgi:hypothetical protein